MRVAMGLALNEGAQRESRSIEFYEVLSTFRFCSATPTLFNSGTLRSQLSSCYLTTVSDDLEGIYEAIKENALLAKYAGGLAQNRPVGGIRGSHGRSIPEEGRAHADPRSLGRPGPSRHSGRHPTAWQAWTR